MNSTCLWSRAESVTSCLMVKSPERKPLCADLPGPHAVLPASWSLEGETLLPALAASR